MASSAGVARAMGQNLVQVGQSLDRVGQACSKIWGLGLGRSRWWRAKFSSFGWQPGTADRKTSSRFFIMY